MSIFGEAQIGNFTKMQEKTYKSLQANYRNLIKHWHWDIYPNVVAWMLPEPYKEEQV